MSDHIPKNCVDQKVPIGRVEASLDGVIRRIITRTYVVLLLGLFHPFEHAIARPFLY